MPGNSSTNLDIDLEVLLRRIEELEERVQRLEEQSTFTAEEMAVSDFAMVPPAPASDRTPALVEDGISDETVAVITAAVASFLGVRARVRHIRLNGSDAWAQQGRVAIMASHRWAMHRS